MDALGALLPVIAAVITSLGTLAAAYLTARRLGKLGVAPAQLQLSSIREETVEAYQAQFKIWETRISTLEADFASCKGRLEEALSENHRLSRVVAVQALEIDRLRGEVESLTARLVWREAK